MIMLISSHLENHFFKQILLIASLPTASSGTTKPINVSCLATLKLRIIERESEKGVLNFHNSSCHQW